MANGKVAKSIYMPEDVQALSYQLCAKYPRHHANDWIYAAMRYYAPRALQGVDGNLVPLDSSDSVIADMLQESVRKLSRSNRPQWTDQQRLAFRALQAKNPTVTAEMVIWDGHDWKVVK